MKSNSLFAFLLSSFYPHAIIKIFEIVKRGARDATNYMGATRKLL